MKSLFFKTVFTSIFIITAFVGQSSYAQNVDSTYNVNSSYTANTQPYQGNNYSNNTSYGNTEYVNYLLQLLAQLQAQFAALQNGNNGFNNNSNYYGDGGYTFSDGSNNGNSNYYNNNDNDDEPDVDTKSARDIQDDSAELRGEVDMNDFDNGIVFFVYGQDEDKIEDVEGDYDEYDDVNDDEEDDEFEVVRVDSDLDGDDEYEEEVNNLEEDEEYFFIICVEYEDDDNDETLECGDVEDFDTDDNNDNNDDNDEEPEVETDSADDIDDDSAELRGSVDMNDFENGRVFFVWGEDEDQVGEVEDEDSFGEIDEDGDDLQKESVDLNFDGNDNFELNVYGLDDDTEIFFRICVQYDDEDNDETLECGDVEDFETDN